MVVLIVALTLYPKASVSVKRSYIIAFYLQTEKEGPTPLVLTEAT